MPLRQSGESGALYLIIRTTLPPAALASSVRTALVPISPELSTSEFRTIQDVVDKAASPRRFVVFFISGFSAFALILAALGIYAVISYSVNQRAAELGIRLALGALIPRPPEENPLPDPRTCGCGSVDRNHCRLVLLQSALLFGITYTDPVTFLGMMAVLAAVACVAGYLPALRVSKIDPMSALRVSQIARMLRSTLTICIFCELKMREAP